jgi:hypothetical protein
MALAGVALAAWQGHTPLNPQLALPRQQHHQQQSWQQAAKELQDRCN